MVSNEEKHFGLLTVMRKSTFKSKEFQNNSLLSRKKQEVIINQKGTMVDHCLEHTYHL